MKRIIVLLVCSLLFTLSAQPQTETSSRKTYSIGVSKMVSHPALDAIEKGMITASSKGSKGLRISLNNEKRAQFRKLLEPIGLQDRLKDNVGLLSGGQRQALTLLMTVMCSFRHVHSAPSCGIGDHGNVIRSFDLVDQLQEFSGKVFAIGYHLNIHASSTSPDAMASTME